MGGSNDPQKPTLSILRAWRSFVEKRPRNDTSAEVFNYIERYPSNELDSPFVSGPNFDISAHTKGVRLARALRKVLLE
jgi:hypothetical protein